MAMTRDDLRNRLLVDALKVRDGSAGICVHLTMNGMPGAAQKYARRSSLAETVIGLLIDDSRESAGLREAGL